MARPTKLTDARIKAIGESIGMAATYEVAANAAGIHAATLYRWKELGEAVLTALANGAKAKDLSEQERLAARFCEVVQRAEGDAELRLIEVARNCALGTPAEVDAEGHTIRAERPPDGRLALEFLGRKYPGRWSRRIHVHDDTPRIPADVNGDRVAEFEQAFRAAFGEQTLDDIDPANLMPAGLEGEAPDVGSNGHRNGSGS